MGNMKFGIFQNADWGLGGLGCMEENKKSASPKKKPLRGKKVGFAEKKLRL